MIIIVILYIVICNEILYSFIVIINCLYCYFFHDLFRYPCFPFAMGLNSAGGLLPSLQATDSLELPERVTEVRPVQRGAQQKCIGITVSHGITTDILKPESHSKYMLAYVNVRKLMDTWF